MASPFVFGNFLETELLDDISTNATVIHITPSMAAKLPIYALAAQEARLVLWDGQNLPEIVGAIENPRTGYLTVVRGKEGTSSRPWPAGTQVICSLTAEIVNAALQAYFDIGVVLAQNYLHLSGGNLSGPLLLSGDPTLALGAVTKQYADSLTGGGLLLIGGTMFGSINMNGYRVLNLPVAVAATEPVRKGEFDAAITLQNQSGTNQAGGISTGGTASAYTFVPAGPVVSSLFQGIAFAATMHVANLDNPTMAWSATPAKPIRAILGQGLPSRFLQQGMPYEFIFDTSADSWLVKGAYRGNFRNRPGDLKWSAIEADHDDCLLCNGRSLLRADFPGLFNNIGTRFGSAGAAFFNIPDQDGLVLVGRGNSLAVTHTLTTTAGSATATVDSAANLTIGMFVIAAAGNVSADTKISDINGLTLTLSAIALTSATNTTRFSQLRDPNSTGTTGGVPFRTQSRREVGQHLHANTVGETPHSHATTAAGGAAALFAAGGAQGFAGGGSASQAVNLGFTINNSTAGVTITNVDSAAPVPMPMLQPSLVMNLFIYAY